MTRTDYPCSGCGLRSCDGRCFLECPADYEDEPLVDVRRDRDPKTGRERVAA